MSGQLLVSISDVSMLRDIKKAISMLKGVTMVKAQRPKPRLYDPETVRQQRYVKESLERAFDEVRRADRGEHKLMTDDEFMAQLKAEGLA